MEGIFKRYRIGIQNFKELRNNNCVYIDKTLSVVSSAGTINISSLIRLAITAHKMRILSYFMLPKN